MNIEQMLVPRNYVFTGSWGHKRTHLIIHGTAGFNSAAEVARYFQAGAPQADGSLAITSVHYIVGLLGEIVQCVEEQDGAGGNGILEPGHDPWWSDNPNLTTFSIETVNQSITNSNKLTAAQQSSLFWLVKDICERNHILMQPATAQGGITGHYSIDPQSRRNCPGPNFPWSELWAYLKGSDNMPIPQGWKDDGARLTAPNGKYYEHGFRDYVLAQANWDKTDQPYEPETSVSQVELHTNRGAGSRQLSPNHMLIHTHDAGVMSSALGAEVAACYNLIASLRKQIATLQSQLKTLPGQVDETLLHQAQATIIDMQHKISQAQEILK